ncbi:MAG: antitermination protein NusG [Pirellulales bacterium]|nr:antitermination protein NusG [Pirellulales bacterium]
MPILPAEPDVYPADLFEACASDPAGHANQSAQWWALYTLPRREKDLLRRLRALELAHYGPLVPRRQRSPQGRVRTSYLPLFSGYVFLRGDNDERHRALTTQCVSRCLEVPCAAELVADLSRIHRLIAGGLAPTPEALVQPGMAVRVKSGPLAGLEGEVVERRGQKRLLVAVRFLQQGASVELDDFAVERIDR